MGWRLRRCGVGLGCYNLGLRRVFCEGLIRDVAIFDSGGEPRGEPGGDSERHACGGGG